MSSPSTNPPALAAITAAGPALSDNVPQQVTYSGQNYIELRLDPADFLAARAAGSEETTP